MYGFDHGGWMFGGGFIMLFWWLLPIALVAALAVYLIRPLGGRSTSQKSARDILNERYARGEVDKEEFEQKKRDLAS